MENYEKPKITYEGGSNDPTPRCASPGLLGVVAYAGAVYDVGAIINYALAVNAYIAGAVAFVILGVDSCWPF